MFNTDIKVTLEHMGWMSKDENPEYKAESWNEREDHYASVAFWYQTGCSIFTARAPGAEERRLPSLDRVAVNAQDFAAAVRHGEGKIAKQSSGLYGGEELVYTPRQQARSWLEIPIEVKVKEPLRLAINTTGSTDGGLYQTSLNGVKIGNPLDFYSDGPVALEFQLLDFWPDPGIYTLRFECVGKNPYSTGYAAGIESVRLLERRPRVARWPRQG